MIMEQEIIQLEKLLNQVIDYIDKRIQIESLEKSNLDKIQNLVNFSSFQSEKDFLDFKEKVQLFKDDNFFEIDLPKVEEIINQSIKKINYLKKINSRSIQEKYNRGKTEFKSKSESKRPNTSILQLIDQNLVSLDSEIIGSHKGLSIKGYFTVDGYFEIEVNGVKNKYNSLRKAFYDVWGSVPTISQWDFWLVDGIPLEEFRKKILLDEN